MVKLSVLMGLFLCPFLVQAGDFQITATKKKESAVRAAPVKSGENTTAIEEVFYEIKVASNAFKETVPVTARYKIVVERQEIGKKAGLETFDRVAGEAPVKALAPRASESVKSELIKLRTQSLTGKWHYTDGGRIKTQDSLVGIWVKLFDENGTEVGEYINPSTLSRKHQWDE